MDKIYNFYDCACYIFNKNCKVGGGIMQDSGMVNGNSRR